MILPTILPDSKKKELTCALANIWPEKHVKTKEKLN